jgi:hypothetical protein
VVGQGARQRADGLLVLASRDGDEVARQFQQHPLLLRRLECIVAADSLEEVADVDTERLSNSIQASRGYAIDPLSTAL